MNEDTVNAECTVPPPGRVGLAAARHPALLSALFALCLGAGLAYPTPSYSAIEIEIAPPVPRVVEVPPPRPGFVWAPGFWAWNGHEHVWHEGRWISERRGHHWVADRWDEHHGRWHYVPGHWER